MHRPDALRPLRRHESLSRNDLGVPPACESLPGSQIEFGQRPTCSSRSTQQDQARIYWVERKMAALPRPSPTRFRFAPQHSSRSNPGFRWLRDDHQALGVHDIVSTALGIEKDQTRPVNGRVFDRNRGRSTGQVRSNAHARINLAVDRRDCKIRPFPRCARRLQAI